MSNAKARVVVTGGNGSLGRYVVSALEGSYDVTIVDTKVSERSAEIGAVDIRDLERLRELFQGVFGIVHLGALDSIVDAPPEAFFDVNARGTWSVFEAAASAKVQSVVHCSSVSVYGLDHTNPEARPSYVPIDEEHPIFPSAPYAFSKVFGEVLGSAYAKKYGMTVASIRLSGVVVPEMVNTLVDLLGEDERTWQKVPRAMPSDLATHVSYDLTRYRDYIDARDAGELFRAALERRTTGYQIYNAGASDTLIPYPTLDYVKHVEGGVLPEVRNRSRFVTDERASPLSSDRAQSELGWKPQHTWMGDAKQRIKQK